VGTYHLEERSGVGKQNLQVKEKGWHGGKKSVEGHEMGCCLSKARQEKQKKKPIDGLWDDPYRGLGVS